METALTLSLGMAEPVAALTRVSATRAPATGWVVPVFKTTPDIWIF
jgi:hypothetical protein